MAAHEAVTDFLAATPLASDLLVLSLLWIVTLVVVRYNDRLYGAVARKQAHFQMSARSLHQLNRISDAFVLVIAALLSLAVMGVGEALWGALTALGVAGIVIAFATKDIASNMISGVIILFDQPFAPGDFIEVGPHSGTVEAVRLRSTTLKSGDGLKVVIPNADFIKKPVTNFTENPERRLEVTVSLLSENDMDRAISVLREVADASSQRIADRPIDVHITGFHEYYLTLQVRFWVPRADLMTAKTDAQKQIARRLHGEGIDLAVPLRRSVEVTRAPRTAPPVTD